MDISMESVGNRIKTRRKELGLTQTDIFNACGIQSGALSRIENGTSTPSVFLFYKIAQELKCDMNWLLTGFVSSNMENIEISKSEELLLCGFRKLGEEDQYEIMEILEMKLRKVKRDGEKMEKLYSLTGENNDTMIG
ncbi:helix-turn-helix domain-containing protein [Blautia faecis]|uniref:helix-turn-helix domain-containing protein n=2 Tax=Blautia TaxID=572511 RepID=UPI001570952A|nr:helix-turn-helix domain-containing protein [Blautia faecis]MCG4749849.1 helix-turn-helix domain-containing protein [Blautia faecis]NSG91894.1 helix-turn-helix domain-containing protein [Blautia faecis]